MSHRSPSAAAPGPLLTDGESRGYRTSWPSREAARAHALFGDPVNTQQSRSLRSQPRIVGRRARVTRRDWRRVFRVLLSRLLESADVLDSL